MQFHAYSSKAKTAALEPFQYEPKPLGPMEVEVAIQHCGICHSDLHLIDNDWGISRYPMVPGHEIVGLVSTMGEMVKHLKPGLRVGIGWQRSACMTCNLCMSGEHNLCPRNEATCAGHFGGFADRIRIDSRFAIALPESLDGAAAAPMFCGGITVFSPFLRFDVKPIHRIGVIGIGGLGHMAVQFARAYGCEVFAFTSSANKADEITQMGAHHVVSSTNPRDLNSLRGKLDFIISTTTADLPWGNFVDCLGANGRLCFVGVPGKPLSLAAGQLLGGRKSVSGSPIGSPEEIRLMLEFAARHGIKPIIERFPMPKVNEALERLRSNQARFRIVLDNATN